MPNAFFAINQIWEQQGVISLIYQLVNDLYALHKLDGYIGSARQISDLFQLGEILHKYDITTQNTLELLFWFQQKITSATNSNSDMAQNLTNEEEIIRLDNDDNQIVITTQHKAKGLEYDILFCPYFKSDAVVNGEYDFSYKMPFFASYYDSTKQKNITELVNSITTANQIVEEDNKEIHRLNYVALTRAKSRLYIYLKESTLTKNGSYHSKAKPDKITELFGYVKNSPQNQNHLLFNYRQFFQNPHDAIKQPENLLGVGTYVRSTITTNCLEQLKLKPENDISSRPQLKQWNNKPTYQLTGFLRQSYSSLTYLAHANQSQAIATDENLKEYSIIDELPPLEKPVYSYDVLNQLKGAVFGNLIHNLCENYPLNLSVARSLLQKYNVDSKYTEELIAIIDKIFSYPILNSKKKDELICLANLHNIIFELEFNLTITKPLSFKNNLTKLLSKYYGADHPYTVACNGLDKISAGFLNGFIDVFFEHGGKYYILDYKTNNLSAYTSTNDGLSDKNNVLVNENAHNHYYLQYLLYLVAIKRYLESRLNLTDTTNLLGGAVYFYIRGIFVKNTLSGGVCIDTSCQAIVRELDLLLKGEVPNGEMICD